MKRKKLTKAQKAAQKEMATKVALFGKLPDYCLTCEEPFDKMDKEQVASWNVVVNEKEERVRLYCPECWQQAQQIIKDFKRHLEEKHEQPKS
jgi:Zn finger protein HypA/HybF involved in hydrogenase expression